MTHTLTWHRPSSLVRGPSNLYALVKQGNVCITADVYRTGDTWAATTEGHTFYNAGSGTDWINGTLPEAKLFHGDHATQRAAKLAAVTLVERALDKVA